MSSFVKYILKLKICTLVSPMFLLEFEFHRMSSLSPSIHLDLLQKGIVSVSLHPAKGKCNKKLYVVPSGASIRCLVCRCYATTDSLHVGGTTSGNQVSSVVGGSDKSERCILLCVYANG